MELTEVRAAGEAWWTLGFEATGPPDVLRGELDAAAALVFALARLVGWNWVWVTPGPMRRGCAGSRRNLKAICRPTFETDPPHFREGLVLWEVVVATAVGIDLGTTNSVIAATEARKPAVATRSLALSP